MDLSEPGIECIYYHIGIEKKLDIYYRSRESSEISQGEEGFYTG
jgi:hypothetical protein